MNCGRGCEIGLTRFEHFTMKTIKEPHGQEFDTLEQYINRIKVMSKYYYFLDFDFFCKIVFHNKLIYDPQFCFKAEQTVIHSVSKDTLFRDYAWTIGY